MPLTVSQATVNVTHPVLAAAPVPRPVERIKKPRDLAATLGKSIKETLVKL